MVDDVAAPAAPPWGPRDPAATPPDPPPGAAPAAARGPASPLQNLIWNVVSTLLLAGWIAWQMNWLWAVAAILGLFVHEIGHLIVINLAGSGPSRIRVIPFFGGAASMARPPLTDFRGVLIALAGPVFGLLAALPFFGLAAWSGEPDWRQGAFVVAAINLLNLAPAPPLDGSKALGPLLARIHPMLERGALLAVGAFAVLWTLSRASPLNPLSLLMPLFIGFATYASLRAPRMRPPATPLTWSEWALGLALYLTALALCLVVASVAALHLGFGFNFGFGNFGGLGARP
jgi:Zn-dependent protease